LGRFPRLNDSTDLWKILITITERKAINQAKFASRIRRTAEGRSVSFVDAKHGESVSPSPWFCTQVAELYLELVGALGDDTLRSIVGWKIEGYTNEEIAAKLDCSLRSVERKLSIIKRKWIEASE
jgi:DNA-directed RNA polymerase specialized sigma24 family protein